jgi:dolichol-phosphate mannosyltransferase
MIAKQHVDTEATARELELSIVIPTFNESGNVVALIERLARALEGIVWEVVFVDDDSPDSTAALLRQEARRDPRVRCLQRIGRRGLSSACVEGMLASSAPCVAVMDADLQHDETLLPRMLESLRRGDLDIVVGSRYIEGGNVGDWPAHRLSFSRIATWLARRVLRAELSDPMSGFFMLRREALEGCVRNLSAIGFKILLDIFASSPRPLRFAELPFVFRMRQAGESKLDLGVAWEYLLLLTEKLVGRAIPARFVAFCFVGGLGVLVHLCVLRFAMQVLKNPFTASQALATVVAMTSNYMFNNMLTYRDLRLRGWGLLRGWLSFILVCSIGALANVGIAGFLFKQEQAGWLVSALAGILVGTVWNYAVTSVYTWHKRA